VLLSQQQPLLRQQSSLQLLPSQQQPSLRQQSSLQLLPSLPQRPLIPRLFLPPILAAGDNPTHFYLFSTHFYAMYHNRLAINS
jgi:hypothetical protein